MKTARKQRRSVPAGWMVQAFVKRVGAERKMLLFTVAVADPEGAIAAVRKQLGGLHAEGPYAIAQMTKRALRGLSPGEISADDFDL